jgi:hypothetical protein
LNVMGEILNNVYVKLTFYVLPLLTYKTQYDNKLTKENQLCIIVI